MGIIKARCYRDGAIQLGVIYHKKSEDRFADRMSLKGQREGLSLSQEEGYPPVVVEEKVGYVGTYVGGWVEVKACGNSFLVPLIFSVK